MDVPDFSMEMMLAGNCIHVSSLFRREDFDRTGGYSADFSFGLEDWDFWLGVLDQGGKAVKIDEVMLHYRIRRSSRNKQISDTKLRRLRRLIWEHHKELFSQYFFDPVESQEYRRLNYSYNKVSKPPKLPMSSPI